MMSGISRNAACVLTLILIIVVSFPAYGSSGDLDSDFGTEGKVNLGHSGDVDALYAVTFQSDGKIVAAGHSDMAFGVMTVNRYNTDGSLDVSFSSDGKAWAKPCEDEAFGIAHGAVVQSDGKVIIGGRCIGNNIGRYFTAARFDASGSPDAGFDDDGVVWSRNGTESAEGFALVSVAGNKIVVAGRMQNGSNSDFAMVRYNEDGSVDTGFGADGYRRTPVGTGTSTAYAAAVQDDGKIILAGTSINGDGNTDFTLARYTSDGALDPSFGTNGIVTHPMGDGDDAARSVAVTADGKIVAAGYAQVGGANDFAVARYLSDGTLDTDFNGNGKVVYSFNSAEDAAFDVELQFDSKIVAAGCATIDGKKVFALVRFNTDGTVDGDFGQSGAVTTSFMGRDDQAYGAGMQSDGKIVLVGAGQDETFLNYVLARYLPGEIIPDVEEETVPALDKTGLLACAAGLVLLGGLRLCRARSS